MAVNDHEHWEELAAGHALNALEPGEEATFAAHLASCPRCQDVLDDHAFVAAQLGTLASAEEVPSWDRIRAGVVGSADVVSLETERTRRRGSRWLGAAAAVVLLAGGMTALLVGRTSSSTQQEVLSACAASTSCRVVHLQDAADLVIDGGHARMLALRMTPAPAGKEYVLWQLPRDGRPTLVAALGTTRNGTVGEAHDLPLPYANTAAFGVSLEPANAIPTKPTKVLVVGTA